MSDIHIEDTWSHDDGKGNGENYHVWFKITGDGHYHCEVVVQFADRRFQYGFGYWLYINGNNTGIGCSVNDRTDKRNNPYSDDGYYDGGISTVEIRGFCGAADYDDCDINMPGASSGNHETVYACKLPSSFPSFKIASVSGEAFTIEHLGLGDNDGGAIFRRHGRNEESDNLVGTKFELKEAKYSKDGESGNHDLAYGVGASGLERGTKYFIGLTYNHPFIKGYGLLGAVVTHKLNMGENPEKLTTRYIEYQGSYYDKQNVDFDISGNGIDWWLAEMVRPYSAANFPEAGDWAGVVAEVTNMAHSINNGSFTSGHINTTGGDFFGSYQYGSMSYDYLTHGREYVLAMQISGYNDTREYKTFTADTLSVYISNLVPHQFSYNFNIKAVGTSGESYTCTYYTSPPGNNVKTKENAASGTEYAVSIGSLESYTDHTIYATATDDFNTVSTSTTSKTLYPYARVFWNGQWHKAYVYVHNGSAWKLTKGHLHNGTSFKEFNAE